MTLGIRLKELRTAQKKTQQQVANIIGVAKSTYSLYESDKREPNVLTLKKLAKAFQTTGDYLLELDAFDDNDEILQDNFNILPLMNQLNDEGQEKVIEYAEGLIALGKYKKHGELEMDQKEA